MFSSQTAFAGEASCNLGNIGANCNDGNGCTSSDKCTVITTCEGTANSNSCGSSTVTSCSGADVCSGGSCSANNFAITTSCDNGNVCTGNGVCDGFGSCSTGLPANDGGNCGSGSGTCSNQDTCSGGFCLPNDQIVGTSCSGTNPNACLDACDGVGNCVNDVIGTGGSCNDGNECTSGGTNDVCATGVCVPRTFDSGGSCGDQSSSECSRPNICLAGVCNPNDLSINTSCDDGVECTGNDVCVSGGLCVGDPVSQTNEPCGPDLTACVASQFCSSGLCITLFELPGFICDDGDGLACTGVCNGIGTCTDGPSTGNSCDDDVECTGSDTCSLGVCIGTPLTSLPGAIITCGEGNTECSFQDTCFEGFCVPNDKLSITACDDNNACTSSLNELCDGEGKCVPGQPLTGNECGAGAAECSAQDTCSNGTCVPNDLGDGTSCGDAGTECTNQDTCQGGTCADAGIQPAGTACGAGGTECSAQDTCSNGTCVPNDEPDNTSCDDGELCTIDEFCKDGVCGMGTETPILACMDDDSEPGPDVGGELIPINTTPLLLAGAQMTASWVIPVIAAGAGIGLVVVSRKNKDE